ncbi:MAG: hypothetical protein CMJ49_10395, partial [Planctomycetaceae bacterium]|nr:hypothetical protein [Planctomycetaceae bacterium]
MKFKTVLIATVMPVLLVTILVIGASSHWYGRSTVSDLSGQILEQTSERVEQHVHHLLEMTAAQGEIFRNLMVDGRLDPLDQRAITAYFLEAMKAHPQLTYLSFGLQSNGNYCHVVRDPRKILTVRLVRRVDEQRFHLTDYFPGESEPHWTKPDHRVDVRVRPYYAAAVEAGEQTWTETYIFIGPAGTPDTPGVTCATPVYDDIGLLGVLTADFDVNGLSDALRQLAIGRETRSAGGGLAFIVEQRRPQPNEPRDQRRHRVVIAHPDPSLLIRPIDPSDRDRGSDWVPADQIGDERVQAFLKQLPADVAGKSLPQDVTPVRYRVNGTTYIGGYKHLSANDHLDWVTCVVIPESVVMAGVWKMSRITTAVAVASVVMAIAAAVVLSRRISRPIEVLVRQSDRIRMGDLEPAPPMNCAVTEVRQLAAAQDRMRVGLRSLMKIERDLQIARQIQLSTLPDHLPQFGDFEINAWCEPAEETGGDTYDVVVGSSMFDGGAARPSPAQTDRAILLLADATGHGVGPALSVTQVRAMLRMAVRSGTDIPTIARHMNDQLHEDLPSGRFITAWLGALDPADHTLTSFSAGQGPLLHYRAAEDRTDLIDTDAMPFGIDSDFPISVRGPLTLMEDDIFTVVSDGVIEAMDRRGEQFGVQRVNDIILAHHRLSVDRVLTALRDAIASSTSLSVS